MEVHQPQSAHVRGYLGVDGLKTGFTDEPGTAWWRARSRGNQRVILVVSGLITKKEREEEPRRLLEWGFKSFKPFRLFDQGEKVSDALVWGGTRHYVPLVGNSNINIILPFNTSGQVSAQIVYDGPIKAPIRKGDQVAMLRVTAADTKATNEIPLYAGDDIGQSNFAIAGSTRFSFSPSAGCCKMPRPLSLEARCDTRPSNPAD